MDTKTREHLGRVGENLKGQDLRPYLGGVVWNF